MNIDDMMLKPPRHQLPGEFQRNPAWFQERIGKLTASRMRSAMAYKKNGEEKIERFNLRNALVAERLTDVIVPSHVTEAMDWGIITEPEAKEAIRKVLGWDIKDCGFFDHPDINWFGASPDCLLGDDAVVEIKCPQTFTHVEWIDANVVPEKHKPQMIVQLLCTGRRVAKFVSYDPRNTVRPLFVKHYAPTKDERDNVEIEARKFLREVEHVFDNVSILKPVESEPERLAELARQEADDLMHQELQSWDQIAYDRIHRES